MVRTADPSIYLLIPYLPASATVEPGKRLRTDRAFDQRGPAQAGCRVEEQVELDRPGVREQVDVTEVWALAVEELRNGGRLGSLV
jgi:hypothetical protein